MHWGYIMTLMLIYAITILNIELINCTVIVTSDRAIVSIIVGDS